MRTVLIFGHSSGLGYELCKTFLKNGYRVVGIARRQNGIESSQLVNVQADLSVKSDIERACRLIGQTYPVFDALIFCRWDA